GKADLSESNTATVVSDQHASNMPRLKDMDVFDSFAASVLWYGDSELYWGQNTEADFLFFVPRSLWPEKPRVFGLVVGDRLFDMKAVLTDNLSYFYGGDFLFDFGLLGLIASGIASGILLSYVDRK